MGSGGCAVYFYGGFSAWSIFLAVEAQFLFSHHMGFRRSRNISRLCHAELVSASPLNFLNPLIAASFMIFYDYLQNSCS